MAPTPESISVGPLEILGPAGTLGIDDGGPWLQAETRYVVRRPDGVVAAGLSGALTVDAGAVEGRLRFGNAVGRVVIAGHGVDVRSARISAAELDAMLGDVVADLAGIPASAASVTGTGFARERRSDRDAPYLAFLTLREAFDDRGPIALGSALRRILARPHERLVSEVRSVPLDAVDRLDATTLLDLVTAPDRVDVTGTALATSAVGRELRGSVPVRVRVARPHSTTNTLENRFIAAVLDHSIDVARSVAAAARASDAAATRELGEAAERVARGLSHVRHSPVFEELRGLDRIPITSTVLRGRPGYRDVLAFWSELLGRSRLIAAATATRLVGIRNADVIYEYWCFFRVVDAVAAALGDGTPTPVARTWQGTGLGFDLRVVFDAGVTVWFNRQFRRSLPASRSYSLSLRPDILVETPTGWHVFDAKFAFDLAKVSGSEADDPVDDGADEPERSPRSHHLQKMHTYRDALDGVRSVRVLYPGSKEEWWPADAENIDGIGAVPLRSESPAQRAALGVLVAGLLSPRSPGSLLREDGDGGLRS